MIPDLRKRLQTTADEEVRAGAESALSDIWSTDKVIARIKQLRGIDVIDDKNPAKPIVAVDLTATATTDVDMKHLKALTGLQSLNLYKTTVSDAGLEHLKGLTNLNWLYLSGTMVTGTGVKNFQQQLSVSIVR